MRSTGNNRNHKREISYQAVLIAYKSEDPREKSGPSTEWSWREQNRSTQKRSEGQRVSQGPSSPISYFPPLASSGQIEYENDEKGRIVEYNTVYVGFFALRALDVELGIYSYISDVKT